MAKSNAERLQEALDKADRERAKAFIADALSLGNPADLSSDVRAQAEQILNED